MLKVLFFLFIFSNIIYSQTTLYCSKSGQDVLLSWEGGTPNYIITYSTTPTFESGNVTLNSENPSTIETHFEALKTNVNYFYDVTGSGEKNRAIAMGGYLPPPLPHLLEIYQYDTGTLSCTINVINSGKISDTICFKVKNINTSDGSWNLVDFNGILQKGLEIINNGDGTYNMKVQIPEGAKSGPVTILSNGIRSTESKLFFIISYNKYNDGTNFRDLSSIVYEDSTNSIWAGDRGDKDKILEIEESGNVVERASRADPVVGDFAGGNFFCYGSSLYSTSNQGTFSKFDTINNTGTAWSKAGDTSSGNPAQILAIAKDNDWDYGYGYVADGMNGVVKKLRKGTTWPSCVADFDFGNFGSISFNNPAGMRYSADNILYFTSADTLYKVYQNETLEVVASGFSNAAGIDLTTEGNILLAEEGRGNIWAISKDLPYKKAKIYSGLNEPVSVAEGIRSNIRHIYVAEKQRILDFMDQGIEIQPKENIRVLISAKHGGGYLEPAFQQEDSILRVFLKTNPPRQATVYLVLHDPPNTSPYETGSIDDNRCMKKDTATIDPNPITTDPSTGIGQAIITFYSVYSDEHCSGDNFYITTHFDSPSNPEVSRSGIITLWKRIYVERDKMFVKGAPIFEDVTQDRNYVIVWNSSVFGIGDIVQIFDRDDQEEPFGEIKEISSIDYPNNKIYFTTNLTGRYKKTISDNLLQPDSFVGILIDADDSNYYPFWETDLSFIRQAYDPAYIDILFPSKGGGPIPNPRWENEDCSNITGDVLKNFSFKWWHPDYKNDINSIHLIGANKLCMQNNETLGRTNSTAQINYSYIFSGFIQESYPGNETNAIGDVTVHEIGHQFDIKEKPCNDPPGPGHCTNNAFTPPNDSEPCVMQKYLQDPPNNIVRFCTQHISTGNNVCFDGSIRRAKDNL